MHSGTPRRPGYPPTRSRRCQASIVNCQSPFRTYPAGSLVVTVSDATPTFSVLGDQTFIQGQPYSINPTFTDFDPGLSWTVAWGDGSSNSTGTGAIPGTLTHTYTSGTSAPYTLNAYVTTTDGTYTNSTTVDAAAPSLSITGASTVAENTQYSLTSTFSDPAGLAPTAWNIAWGDGTTTTTSGASTSFTHAYSHALDSGAYTIAAYAIDSNGTYYAAPDYVTVTPVTPTVSITSNSPITLTGTLVLTNHTTDPYGVYDIEGWTIDWGDGDTAYYAENPTNFVHAYNLPGSRNVIATAQTPSGTYAQTLSVNVSGSGTVGLTAIDATQSQPYYVSVSFTEPGDVHMTGYTVGWGDGTTTGYSTEPDYGGWARHVYHTYGTLTLGAEIDTDDATYYTTATIRVRPNYGYTFGGIAVAQSGHPYDLHVDYAGDDPLPAFTVYWGDGSSNTTTSRGVLEHVYSFDPNYPYPAPWVYNVRAVTIVASEGLTTLTSGGGGIRVYPSGPGQLTGTGLSTALNNSADFRK